MRGVVTAKAEVKIVTLARIVIIEYIISWNNKIIDIKRFLRLLDVWWSCTSAV